MDRHQACLIFLADVLQDVLLVTPSNDTVLCHVLQVLHFDGVKIRIFFETANEMLPKVQNFDRFGTVSRIFVIRDLSSFSEISLFSIPICI